MYEQYLLIMYKFNIVAEQSRWLSNHMKSNFFDFLSKGRLSRSYSSGNVKHVRFYIHKYESDHVIQINQSEKKM
jgi:hypothetical protein